MGSNPFAGGTVGRMLADAAVRYGDREAIVFGDERITYGELRRRVDRLARGLLALGIRKDDKVALWLPNRPAWLVAQHACARIGATVVALNTRYKAHELSYILGQSDATTLILTDHLGPLDFLEILDEVLPDLKKAEPGALHAEKFPLLRRVIVDAEDPYPGTVRLRDVLEAGDRPDLESSLRQAQSSVGPDDVFTILYTSGTTSFPKGAMISHANCLPHGWNCGAQLRITADDRILHALPFSGTWGGVNIPLTAFTHGACLILMESFDPGVALYLMEKERITVWNAVDAMILGLLEHPDLHRYDRSSLRTGGVAMTSGGAQSLFDEVVARIGLRQAFQPYGMTEVNALALYHDLDEPAESRKLPGIWPAPGLEVRVVNPETGQPCKPGEEGELQHLGSLVTRGYYKKPEETAKAFTEDGWFRSGDLAVRDEAGRTIFKGRLREVLRISHFMVAPREIEEFLMAHPKVHQAFVVGVPDVKLGEAPVAYVIPKEGEILSEAELMAHCKGQIASYKIPRHVRLVKDVPRTPGPHGDKVQKARLRDQAIQEFGQEAQP
ncbi:MAG: AMP-binding protein [Candidatus Rokubacteria bacterium]|nr:AMP-binding protein [Candidatus Rokubacteria bacterium]